MRILAIPATNHVGGLNHQLVGSAAAVLGELVPDCEVEIIDLNEYEMPIYSPVREEAGGPPERAQQLFAKIGEADALVLSFAEYNGSYTPAWKNTYDWMSRIDQKVYQGKKVAMFAASPGPRAGAGVLGSATTAAPFFGGELVGSVGVGTFMTSFDPEAGQIVDDALRGEFRSVLAALVS